MENAKESPSTAYYAVTLGLASGKRILRSNNERAFIIGILQDVLGRRSLLEEPEARFLLAAHIDLLAFSILDQDVKLVLFSIAKSSAYMFAQLIAERLKDFQSEWQLVPSFHAHKDDPIRIKIVKLSGPYGALNASAALHVRHNNWEYDRYSSIGFYLYDRRGDWMHLWRVSRLYENDSETYRKLLTEQLQHIYRKNSVPIIQPFVPLSHVL